MTTRDAAAEAERGLLPRLGALLRLCGSVVAWLLLLTMGGLFVAAGVDGLRTPSTHYRPVEATVVTARPSVTRGAPDTSSRNSWSVRVSLLYRYQTGGVSYHGGGLLDLGRAGSPSEAEERAAAAAARYAPGARFEAFVDPDDPAQSVLERRGALWGLPALAFGAIFLLTGIGSAVMGVRDWWRRRRGAGAEPSAADRATDRWLDRASIVLLVVLALAFIAVVIEREAPIMAVLLGLVWIIGLISLFGRRR